MWSEVLTTIGLFGLFFIVIPVCWFTADLIVNYYKQNKEKTKNEMDRRS